MNTPPAAGSLWLVPSPLDFGCDVEVPLPALMPLNTLEVTARLHHWVCENAKSTRAYLKRVNAVAPFQGFLQTYRKQMAGRGAPGKSPHGPHPTAGLYGGP